MKKITASRLLELIDYNPATGIFTWKPRAGNFNRAWRVAGTPDKDGYLLIRADGVTYKAHRLAWLYVHGRWPSEQIDHINHVKDDNRIANLRECSIYENLAHRVFGTKSATKIAHVHPSLRRFRVRMAVAGKMRNFGSHESAELAELVASEVRRRLGLP